MKRHESLPSVSYYEVTWDVDSRAIVVKRTAFVGERRVYFQDGSYMQRERFEREKAKTSEQAVETAKIQLHRAIALAERKIADYHKRIGSLEDPKHVDATEEAREKRDPFRYVRRTFAGDEE